MNLNTDFDTIAAISTPRGKGGIAVIRISGSEALDVAERFFKAKSGKALRDVRPSSAVYGDIFDGASFDFPIDDGLATVFFAPRSFTGEDTVEISCHGGCYITEKVLSSAIASGARLARRGEFTRRAFINGRIRLEEAEAIGGILDAETDAQVKLFSKGSASALSSAVDSIKSDILSMLTELYAKIDYPEEDLSGIPRDELPKRIGSLLERCERLKATYKTGYAVTKGIKTVICGRANAGKSTLYNALLGYEAAIVTDIEGTTRDVLEHTLSLGDLTLRLYDTAGLRSDATDKAELIGIERTRRALGDAELIFAVFDSSAPLTEQDRELIRELRDTDKTVISVLTKNDISRTDCDFEEIYSAFENVVRVNARDGDTSELVSLTQSLYIDESIDLGHDAVLVGERQENAIEGAATALREAYNVACDGFYEDISAMYLEGAFTALSEIDGREISEDIVDGIFAKFCVGK